MERRHQGMEGGAAVSDTPLADALKDRYCFSHLDWYKLCGELEREIAALREVRRAGGTRDKAKSA